MNKSDSTLPTCSQIERYMSIIIFSIFPSKEPELQAGILHFLDKSPMVPNAWVPRRTGHINKVLMMTSRMNLSH